MHFILVSLNVYKPINFKPLRSQLSIHPPTYQQNLWRFAFWDGITEGNSDTLMSWFRVKGNQMNMLLLNDL